MSTIKVDTIATRTGSGNITASNTIAGNVTGNVTGNVITSSITTASGDLTVDVAGDIILDADGADVKLSDGGTVYGELTNAASYLRIKNPIQDQDIEISGNDGGSAITALRFDMSDAGRAVFNAGVSLGGNDAAHTLDDYEEGTWTPNCATPGVSGSYSVQLGQYIKIGKLVQCIFNLTTSSSYTGNTTHVFRLGGLPFANKAYNGSLYAGGNIGYYFNINTSDSAKQMVYQIPSGASTSFELKGTGDNSGEISIIVSNMNSNSVIRGQLVYHTA